MKKILVLVLIVSFSGCACNKDKKITSANKPVEAQRSVASPDAPTVPNPSMPVVP